MSTSISRRALLRLGSGLVAGALMGRSLRTAASTNTDSLPAFDEVASWVSYLIGLGTRYTGSSSEARYCDFLQDRLERLGLRVHRDRLTFTRWEPKRWQLQDDGGNIYQTASYFPYSGSTPAPGLSGRLVYCGTQLTPTSFRTPDGRVISNAGAFFAPARGNIALMDVVLPILNFDTVMKPVGFAEPSDAPGWPKTFVHTVMGGHENPPALVSARAHGVRAVVCTWTNLSDELAQDQYAPFDTPYQGLPALWVNRATASRLKTAAHEGRSGTVTLEATMAAGSVSHSLWAVLPGNDSSENVIVNTHTDGGNIYEENGGLALLAMAQHFSSMPRSQRRRDMIFAFVTGHFQQPQFTTPGGFGATSTWKAAHPELWEKAVTGMTVEHLGAREWTDDAGTTRYHATGLPGWSWTYTTTQGRRIPATAERDIYIGAARAWANPRAAAVVPGSAKIYVGEGAQFWHDGIPTISHIPGPSNLLQAKAPDFGKITFDPRLMYTQIRTLTLALTRVQDTAAVQLRK